LGFLETGQLSAKTKDFRYWIFLDFLGFSRPKRDFSMGCAGFCGEDFSKALLPGAPWELGPRELCGCAESFMTQV
jgi:hypothetical protein